MEFPAAMRLRCAGLAIALAGMAMAPAAASVAVGKDYGGITLLTMSPNPGVEYDVYLVDPVYALEQMIRALDIIYRESPFSAGKIEALKKDGKVEIIYDPNHPNPDTSMASIQVAKFLPRYRGIDGHGGKNYLAVVDRHGIKWPLRELAAVLVHELVGHGTQHLNDRFKSLRNVDLECEAWLYEELAYQDFRFDKSSREMIKFRQQLEGINLTPGHCSEFKRYMQKTMPGRMRFWESLNPDVPKLLDAFEDYLKDLRDKGLM